MFGGFSSNDNVSARRDNVLFYVSIYVLLKGTQEYLGDISANNKAKRKCYMSHQRLYGNLSFDQRNFLALTDLSLLSMSPYLLERREKKRTKCDLPSWREICLFQWNYSDTLRGISRCKMSSL